MSKITLCNDSSKLNLFNSKVNLLNDYICRLEISIKYSTQNGPSRSRTVIGLEMKENNLLREVCATNP